MPKKPKSPKSENKPKSFYSLHPWQCRHHADYSEIEAYVEASGKWETVAVIKPTSGASTEAVATFITHLINDNQKNANLLQAAMEALELVIEDNGLTFASEQAADSVVSRIRKRMG